MKKNRPYLIAFAILVILTILVLQNRRKGSYSSSDMGFAIKDTVLVSSVVISRPGEEVILTKLGDDWRVNGNFPAHPDRIKGLLILLSRLEASAPVSGSIAADILEGLDRDGVHVRIQMQDGSGKSYRIYHDMGGSERSFMQLEGSDEIFRMSVRGYRGTDLASLYVIDARYWRSNILISILPGDIRYVFLENKHNPDASFHLNREEDSSFKLGVGVLPGSWTDPNEDKLRQYLQGRS